MLNSVVNLHKAVSFFSRHRVVHALLDNDDAGQKALARLGESLPSSEVIVEFLQKERITTREGLTAYRKPLEEQVLSLMKERRELYRKEPGGMRIQEINGELKELRKKIRLSQQIEKQSLEMEERLRQAKEQEEVQEMSGKQRREAEWNR